MGREGGRVQRGSWQNSLEFWRKGQQLGVGTGVLCSADPTDSVFHFPKLPLSLESKVATIHGKNVAYSLDKIRLQSRLSRDQPLVAKKTINSNNWIHKKKFKKLFNYFTKGIWKNCWKWQKPVPNHFADHIRLKSLYCQQVRVSEV